MLSYKRSTRVAEQIQREISKIVQELKEPKMGFATITGVKLTDDLQSARVFFSVIGTENEVAETCRILKDSVPSIRHQLAAKMNLRRTPTLEFVFDETPAKAGRVLELLEKIRSEENNNKNGA